MGGSGTPFIFLNLGSQSKEHKINGVPVFVFPTLRAEILENEGYPRLLTHPSKYNICVIMFENLVLF